LVSLSCKDGREAEVFSTRKLTTGAVLTIAALAAATSIAPPSAVGAPPADWSAHAFFDRANPYTGGSCYRLELDLQVRQTTAYVDYWARDTCSNIDSDHLTGSTALTPDQVSISSGSASLTNVVVDVSSIPGGFGYIQRFTFNLTWDQAGHPSVAPPALNGGDVVFRVPTTVSGPVVDLGGTTLFTGADVSDAETSRILHSGS
jgi:hypothetical protein